MSWRFGVKVRDRKRDVFLGNYHHGTTEDIQLGGDGRELLDQLPQLGAGPPRTSHLGVMRGQMPWKRPCARGQTQRATRPRAFSHGSWARQWTGCVFLGSSEWEGVEGERLKSIRSASQRLDWETHEIGEVGTTAAEAHPLAPKPERAARQRRRAVWRTASGLPRAWAVRCIWRNSVGVTPVAARNARVKAL